MKGNVLFVLTAHDRLGDTGEPTGFDLTEAATPYRVLTEAGYSVDFATPGGKSAPVDPNSLDREDDTDGQQFMADESIQKSLDQPLRPEALEGQQYDAIFFPGGHGTMWDFPDNEELQRLARECYEAGGVIASICHGPAAFVNLRLSDRSYFVNDRRMVSFTNAEEEAVDKTDVVPFLLESALRKRGAIFEGGGNMEDQVVVDGRFVTGQNPASAESLGNAIVDTLADTSSERSAAE